MFVRILYICSLSLSFSQSGVCFVAGVGSEFAPQEFLLHVLLLDPEAGDDGALVNDEQGLFAELKTCYFLYESPILYRKRGLFIVQTTKTRVHVPFRKKILFLVLFVNT